ncbi:MAG: GTPase domain-containing protein [Promethearchaeota archaeon]
MLRQFLVFYKGEIIFTHSYAIGLDIDELTKAKETMQTLAVSGKTINRPILNYQIFHYQKGTVQFSFIADMSDTYNYIDKIMKKTISKFSLFFPDPLEIKESINSKEAFIKFLYEAQHELHTKIALIGPLGAGKTTLYDLIRNDDERSIMNFAKSSTVSIGELQFDIWDMQLDDNYSLLWAKFIGGSDLVIFLIDASNYNLKVLTHFLNLHKKESNLAKLLLVANKSDLVSDDEIKRIKTELNNIEINELSLIKPNAKSRIFRYISDKFQLKKTLPSNFDDLIKQAEKFESEGNTVGALAKYKELINICEQYQEIEQENQFKLKCNELNIKLNKAIEERKKEEKKKEFAPANIIKFSDEVKVKQLPSVKPVSQPINENFINSDNVKKTEIPIINEKLKIQNETTKTQKLKKLKLKPGDIKIDLKHLKIQEMLSQKAVEMSGSSSKEKNSTIIEIDPNNLKTDQDYAEALQIMIKNEGSALSIDLCMEFINEMKNDLGRDISYEDLIIAVDMFLKLERNA